MKTLIKIAYKNVLRNKKRSTLTFLAITIGIFAFLFSNCLINGIDETTLKNFLNTTIPSIKIYNVNHFENRNDQPLENLIDNPSDIESKIKDVNGKIVISERLKFKGRIIRDVNEFICSVIGIDTEKDAKSFKIISSIVENQARSKEKILEMFKTQQNACIIGLGLKNALEINLDEEIEIYTRTKNGAHNANSYKVVGFFNTENPEVDAFAVVMKLADADALADAEGSVTEINVNCPGRDMKILLPIEEKINKILSKEYHGYSWEEQLSDLLTFFKLRHFGQYIIIIFLLILAIAGITNTMLMAVFERTKEIGTLSAIGMKSHKIVLLFLFEGMILGFIGSIIAIIISALPVFFLSHFGLSVSNSDLTVNAPSKIYGFISWYYYPLSVLIAVLTAGFATLYPSIKAVRLNIAEVLRGK